MHMHAEKGGVGMERSQETGEDLSTDLTPQRAAIQPLFHLLRLTVSFITRIG